MAKQKNRKKRPQGSGNTQEKEGDAMAEDSGFQVSPTLWGYTMESDFEEPRMGLRRYFKLIGAAMLLAAIALWLVPVSAGDTRTLILKGALSVFFACMGAIFLLAPPRQLRRQVQVDLKRDEIRAGWLTRLGDFHMENLIPFDEVELVFLCNETGEPQDVNLILLTGDEDFALIVAQSDREDLEPWRNKLVCDLNQAASRADPRKPRRKCPDIPSMRDLWAKNEGVAAV